VGLFWEIHGKRFPRRRQAASAAVWAVTGAQIHKYSIPSPWASEGPKSSPCPAAPSPTPGRSLWYLRLASNIVHDYAARNSWSHCLRHTPVFRPSGLRRSVGKTTNRIPMPIFPQRNYLRTGWFRRFEFLSTKNSRPTEETIRDNEAEMERLRFPTGN
jgi:hypothetical protein